MKSNKFAVGDQVVKQTGYSFPGEVRAVVITRAGRTRYVVEATGVGYDGMLHIFNSEQLMLREDEKKEAAE